MNSSSLSHNDKGDMISMMHNESNRIGFRNRTVVMALIIVLLTGLFVCAETMFVDAATPSPSATGKVNSKSGLVLRKSASTSSKKIKTLKDNTSIKISKVVFKSKTSTSAKNKWYYITAGSSKGYVRADYVDNIKYSAVSGKVTKKCNYRKGAGIKMSKAGTLAKGKAVTIYLKATPVSSTKGSSSTWYMIKQGSKYYYVCSANVDITGSIFVKNTDTPTAPATKPESTSTGTSTAGKFASMTDAEFDKYLDSQGFPESYKSKIKTLHKAHPNWVFVALKTGISWSTALSKHSADGKSLIHASLPLSYRATDSKSFTGSSVKLYKTASTDTSLGTIPNNQAAELISETWDGTTRWNNVKLKDGKVGFAKGTPASQSHT